MTDKEPLDAIAGLGAAIHAGDCLWYKTGYRECDCGYAERADRWERHDEELSVDRHPPQDAPEVAALVARLRLRSVQTSIEDRAICYEAADALTRISAERDATNLNAQHLYEMLECTEDHFQRLEAERDKATALLRELVTLVRGECPSLLNEDSGGDANLSIAIDAALGESHE